MQTYKKGFIFYFDNSRQLERLSPEACGQVVLALTAYAERISRGEDAEPYLQEQMRRLSPDASMALHFMANTALRDQCAYDESIARRTDWKNRQSRKWGQQTTGPAAPDADDLTQRNADTLRYI